MKSQENTSYKTLCENYSKQYTLGYLGPNMSNKLACIAIICYLTNTLRKKDKNITCYDILLKVGKDFSETDKKTFLMSLGAICEDFMYGCDKFPDLGIPVKEMPKQLKILLDNYLPF